MIPERAAGFSRLLRHVFEGNDDIAKQRPAIAYSRRKRKDVCRFIPVAPSKIERTDFIIIAEPHANLGMGMHALADLGEGRRNDVLRQRVDIAGGEPCRIYDIDVDGDRHAGPRRVRATSCASVYRAREAAS